VSCLFGLCKLRDEKVAVLPKLPRQYLRSIVVYQTIHASFVPIRAACIFEEALDGFDGAFHRDREALARFVQVFPEIRAQNASLVLGDMGSGLRISYLEHINPHLSVFLTLRSRDLVISSVAVVD
jgi:hypothetical protein